MEVEVQLQAFLTLLKMRWVVSLRPGHFTSGEARAGLDAVTKRKISFACRESNRGRCGQDEALWL